MTNNEMIVNFGPELDNFEEIGTMLRRYSHVHPLIRGKHDLSSHCIDCKRHKYFQKQFKQKIKNLENVDMALLRKSIHGLSQEEISELFSDRSDLLREIRIFEWSADPKIAFHDHKCKNC